jgi:hypothetical protein
VDEDELEDVDCVVEEVRSASRPSMKVRVEMSRPIMVRNWRCHPKESFCEKR